MGGGWISRVKFVSIYKHYKSQKNLEKKKKQKKICCRRMMWYLNGMILQSKFDDTQKKIDMKLCI